MSKICFWLVETRHQCLWQLLYCHSDWWSLVWSQMMHINHVFKKEVSFYCLKPSIISHQMQKQLATSHINIFTANVVYRTVCGQFHASSLFPLSELRWEISRQWNANGHCFISGAVMTKGVALIYCRLVTLVLNWSNMLQTSSAERLHLSSAKRSLHNWDLGSSLHDPKPLTLFTVTGCPTHTHTDKWMDTLIYTPLSPHSWSLLQRLILFAVQHLSLLLFLSCPGYYCLFFS